MYHTDPFSIYICHNICRQAMQLICFGPYMVPSPTHHQTKNTHVATERVFVAAVVPSVRAQQASGARTHAAGSASRGLVAPLRLLVVQKTRTELLLECSEKVWNMLSGQHCMPLALSSHSQAKIEDRSYNVVAFWPGAWLDRGAKERIYGTLQHDICNTGKR